MLFLSVTIEQFHPETQSKHTVCAGSAIVKVHEYSETDFCFYF